MTKRLAITGITGCQGTAVARTMLARGWKVRGLTRRARSRAARALTSEGVELVEGDMDHEASLVSLLAGADAVYAVTDFFRNGPDGEARQGKAVADVAKQLGVAHFVYASIASADEHTGVPHFDSKREVEVHVGRLGLAATILRPTLFMEDLVDPRYHPPLNWGMISKVVGEQRPLPWIAVDDIAEVAAKALCDPGSWIGRVEALAGDELSIASARAIFESVAGRRPRSWSMPTWLFRLAVNRSLGTMWQWLAENRWTASVAGTHELHAAQRLEPWLRARLT